MKLYQLPAPSCPYYPAPGQALPASLPLPPQHVAEGGHGQRADGAAQH